MRCNLTWRRRSACASTRCLVCRALSSIPTLRLRLAARMGRSAGFALASLHTVRRYVTEASCRDKKREFGEARRTSATQPRKVGVRCLVDPDLVVALGDYTLGHACVG